MYTDEELQVIMKKLKFIALDDAHTNAYNVMAPCILGYYYSTEKKDTKKALEYYLKCIKFYRTNKEPYAEELKEDVVSTYYNACYSAGEIYYLQDDTIGPVFGQDVECEVRINWKKANLKKAKEFLKEAADDGNNMDACYYLGNILLHQENPRSIKYLERAAKNGHASAQTKLGQCYENGVFVPKNKEKALHLFRSAMNLGDLGAKEELQKYFQ